jgi:uncharacterized NAD(P)/FAD-binding protein YdhS
MKVMIVGGGASGTLVAINLARQTTEEISVVIAEPLELIGRGIAYGAVDPNHLLNVPAGKMSAIVETPDHFALWAGIKVHEFAPRKVYGEYLAETLAASLLSNSSSSVTHLKDLVTSIALNDSGVFNVKFKGSQESSFDAVILATGYGRSVSVPALSSIEGDLRIVSDPWRESYEKFVGTLVCLGTGLTFLDHALAHIKSDDRNRVVGISRTGLLPQAHLDKAGPMVDLPNSARSSPASLMEFVKSSDDWRSALDSVRKELPLIWRSWGFENQKDFWTNHLRWWNVHRHRSSSFVNKELQSAIRDGRITILQDEVESVNSGESGIELKLASGKRLSGHLIVNCLGYQGNSESVLVRNLILNNLAAIDEHEIGLKTNFPQHELVNTQGVPIKGLYALGPLLLGERFETTAIPEIRVQAKEIATAILN